MVPLTCTEWFASGDNCHIHKIQKLRDVIRIHASSMGWIVFDMKESNEEWMHNSDNRHVVTCMQFDKIFNKYDLLLTSYLFLDNELQFTQDVYSLACSYILPSCCNNDITFIAFPHRIASPIDIGFLHNLLSCCQGNPVVSKVASCTFDIAMIFDIWRILHNLFQVWLWNNI